MGRFVIPESDDNLLAECGVETFRAGGPGGQHANKVESAVRLTHVPSGIVVTSRASRSQYRNKQLALESLRRKLVALDKPDIPRVPTKPTRASKKRRIEAKKRRSEKKANRRQPSADD